MSTIGTWLQRAAWRFGYQVRKLPARRRFDRGFDAFEDQARLLRDEPPQVILDVGANVGVVTKRYHALFPNAVVHAFEPLPATYRELTAAIRGMHDVHAHNLAVADRSGRETFFLNRDHKTNSLLPIADHYNERYANSDATLPIGQAEVTTTTLDAFCQEHGIAHVGVLKLDIQGGELMALRGAQGLLARAAIDLVFSEVLFAEVYAGQACFHQLSALLADAGYVLFDLYPLNYGRNGLLTWTDALWLSPKLAARRRGPP